MTTPAPTPLHPLTFAERFWAQVRGPESDDIPEPLRSVVLVRHFLSSLDRLDAASPRKAAAALVAMLRQAELEGDLSYASPEQVRGEILDTRSVVFSLGVVLFERLTGRHPFGAENNRPRRIDRIRKGELGSGVNSFPTVAAGLRSVLVRAMSPFPEERWPDLRQMRELLASFISAESPSPRLPGTGSDQPSGRADQGRAHGHRLRPRADAGGRGARPAADRAAGHRAAARRRRRGPRSGWRCRPPASPRVTGATAPARRPPPEHAAHRGRRAAPGHRAAAGVDRADQRQRRHPHPRRADRSAGRDHRPEHAGRPRDRPPDRRRAPRGQRAVDCRRSDRAAAAGAAAGAAPAAPPHPRRPPALHAASRRHRSRRSSPAATDRRRAPAVTLPSGCRPTPSRSRSSN